MVVALQGGGPAGGDQEVAQLDVPGAVAPGRSACGAGLPRRTRGAAPPPSSTRRARRLTSPMKCTLPATRGARRPPRGYAMLPAARAGSPPMVNVAQLVELLVVVQAVVGSSPIVHPSGRRPRAGVAEPVDALGLGPSGATLGGSSPLTRISRARMTAQPMPLTAEVTPLEENRVRLDVAVPEDEVQRRMERAIRAARARGARARVPARQGAGRGHRAARRPRGGRAGDAEGIAGRLVLRGGRRGRRRADRRPGPRPGRRARRGRPHVQGDGPGAPEGRRSATTAASRSAGPSPRCPRARSRQQLEAPARPGARACSRWSGRPPTGDFLDRSTSTGASTGKPLRNASARDYLVELGRRPAGARVRRAASRA